MLLAEAKSYIGKLCSIVWNDRAGKENNTVSKIYDATYVPLYGGYLVTDADDIRLDRICHVDLIEEGIKEGVKPAVATEKVAA